jgi:hypothetical protein
LPDAQKQKQKRDENRSLFAEWTATFKTFYLIISFLGAIQNSYSSATFEWKHGAAVVDLATNGTTAVYGPRHGAAMCAGILRFNFADFFPLIFAYWAVYALQL